MILGNKFHEHTDGYMVGLTSKGTEFFFDEEDLDVVQHFTWCINSHGYLHTQDRSNGHQTITFHRMVLHLEDPNIFTDHINHDKLDNRKSNLRSCSRQENQCNRSINKDNTTGYKGVCWNKIMSKWHVRISISKKETHIGYFTDKHEAAKAYNKVALKYHGEFAKLNDV